VTGWPHERYGPAPTPAAEAARAHEAELQKIAEQLGEPIEIVREMSDAIKCCADEGFAEARNDRWQRATEAAIDGIADPTNYSMTVAKAVDAAISAAARVRVDADITQEVRDRHPDLMIKTTELKSMIEVAFAAAGFEVEQ
jgi:hypothetical protein